MKYYFLIAVFTTITIPLLSQTNYIGIFHSEDLSNPEIHADGIFKFFIESDNEMRKGNTERAILALDNAIAQNPFFAEIYLKRSKLLFTLGRYSEAREDLAHAMQLNPYLGIFHNSTQKMGKLQLIALQIQQHEDFIEDNISPEIGSIWEQSLEKKLAGDISGAYTDLRTVFDRLPQPEALLYDLRGSMHFLMEDYYKAVNDYSQAILLEPNVAEYYFNRGVARLFTYNRSAACEDLEKSKDLGYERSEDKLRYFCYY